MNRPLTAAAVALSTLFGASAFAAPCHGAQPTYSPPAPVYTAPAPTYAPAYVPTTVSYDERELHGWRKHEWQRFQREQAIREQQENDYLAQERANFVSQWGWDGRRMAWFNQHQVDERAQFESAQAARQNAFLTELAMNRGRHHFHEAEYDYD